MIAVALLVAVTRSRVLRAAQSVKHVTSGAAAEPLMSPSVYDMGEYIGGKMRFSFKETEAAAGSIQFWESLDGTVNELAELTADEAVGASGTGSVFIEVVPRFLYITVTRTAADFGIFSTITVTRPLR